MANNNQKKESSFISGMSWLGAFLIGFYGYSLNESFETGLWYALIGFGIGSLGGTIIKGFFQWLAMTIILLLSILIFKTRIEAVLGIDLDPLISSVLE